MAKHVNMKRSLRPTVLKRRHPKHYRVLQPYVAQSEKLCFANEVFGNVSNEELERPNDYSVGGYHPIHIGDQLHSNRYRVMHKLGQGGYGVVWLCLDQHAPQPTYVAIKILRANNREVFDGDHFMNLALIAAENKNQGPLDTRQYFCLAQNQFTSKSKNGTHKCLIYPVLGPPICMANEIFKNDVGSLQSIAREATNALAVMHELGIGHGDFRPSNILLRLASLNNMPVDRLLALFGEPELEPLGVLGHPDMIPSLKYLVYPMSFTGSAYSMILHSIQVIDFGQSYETTTGSASRRGIPANYASPEMVLGRKVDQASDCWSLGCVIYEVRLGTPIFDISYIGEVPPRTYLAEVADVLGELPEELAMQFNIERPALMKSLRSTRMKTIQRHLQDNAVEQEKPMTNAETVDLADLLERLLKYSPGDRMRASEILDHRWFHSRYNLEES